VRSHPDVFAYVRQSSRQEVVIALNMGAQAREAALDALSGSEWRVLLSSRRGTAEPIDVNRLHLGAFEALLMERVSDV
jgi:Maltogenic Amylase, C-terminal domain